jgi:restriction endonuclease S subunit
LTLPRARHRLPDSWKEVSLRDILTEAQYGLSLPMHPRGQYPILRMAAIQDGGVSLEDLKYVDLPEKIAAQYLLHHGDILFNRTNSGDLVGKVGVYRSNTAAVFASYLVRLKVKPHLVDPYFLGSLLDTHPIQCRIRRYATPGVQQVNINASNLQKVSITLPGGEKGLEEQRAIARILDAADAAIERTRTAIEKARQLRLAIVQQFFEAGVGRIASADRPGNSLAKGWRLEATSKLLAGEPKNGISPRTEAEPPGFVTFSIAAVRDGRVDLLNREHWKYARIEPGVAQEFLLRRGNC